MAPCCTVFMLLRGALKLRVSLNPCRTPAPMLVRVRFTAEGTRVTAPDGSKIVLSESSTIIGVASNNANNNYES